MNPILLAVIVVGAVGLVSAVLLFVVSKKFAVHEDPRIGQVAEVLPQANCGGCGFALSICSASSIMAFRYPRLP